MLAAELRDPVRRDGARLAVLARRIALRLAVDGRRRRDDDANARGRARFEDALRREQVPPDVDRKDVAEAAHARLRREMEDAVDAVEVELLVGEVDAQHLEAARVLFLLGRVVVVREAVDADDVVPGLLQRARELRADETRSARDDVSHLGTIP
jgi:hypothetical protein